jgi:hypothetical protein
MRTDFDTTNLFPGRGSGRDIQSALSGSSGRHEIEILFIRVCFGIPCG